MPQPAISVNVRRGAAQARVFRFTEEFRIGRDEACAVRFTRNPRVASFHARVVCIDGVWWVVDLNSEAGTFVGSRRITRVPVHTQEEITLGRRGPALILTAEPAATPDADGPPGGGAARVEESSGRDVSGALAGEPARKRPPVTPDAFARAHARQRLWFTVGIGLMSALLLMVGVYALTQRFAVVEHQRELARYREHAKEIFYDMKTTELEIVQLAETLEQVAGPDRRQPLALIRQRRQAELQRYDAFMQSLGFYRRLSAEERLIHRVVNRFGEFSLDMPPAFMDSVKHYIRKWQRTSRFRRAVQRAHESGYTPMIVKTLLNHDLPPEFFYLALQESDFIPNQTGPPTRYGYAKGMWQFIPETARSYDLEIGPLAGIAGFDPEDDRFDVNKSTLAAARYLRDIYGTRVQASGLLVLASYNWGENNVLRYIDRLPDHPRGRNFWQLLTLYGDRLPEETRRYVFYILSAAVIGEEPRLFGFDLDNPLMSVQVGRSL